MTVSREFSVLYIVALGLCVAQEFTLPVITCRRSVNDYPTCLRNAIQESWPEIVKGFPEFDFPRLDPYVYESYHTSVENEYVNVNIRLSNVTMMGLANTRFLDVRPHFLDDIFRMKIDLRIPKLYIEGILEAKDNYGFMKLNNQGKFNLSITDIKQTWDITGYVANDRWTVEQFNVIPEIGPVEVYFELFDNKEMNDVAVQFMNFNPQLPRFYQETLSSMASIMDTCLVNLVNQFFSNISFSKLFPI